jgi:hypothetical protein
MRATTPTTTAATAASVLTTCQVIVHQDTGDRRSALTLVCLQVDLAHFTRKERLHLRQSNPHRAISQVPGQRGSTI